MNRPDQTIKTAYPERLAAPARGALGWNILAVLFLLIGVALGGLTFKEKMSSVPLTVGEFSDAQAGSQSSVSFAGVQWIPFDAYAPVFAARDVFKTDDEKILEATRQAEVAAHMPAANWGAGYQLMGVIVDADPRAIVRTLDPPGVLTLAIGDRLGDATLVEIDEHRAVFDHQNARVELRFSDKPAL